MIRVIALNELRRRLRDRSVLIGCLAAPLLMSAVLGLSFAGSSSTSALKIGVSGASPALVSAAVQASQLPHGVTVVSLPSEDAVKSDVTNGDLAGGVAVQPGQMHLDSLLVPVIDPGATTTPGFDVVTRGTSQLGQEYAESVAARYLERALRAAGAGATRPASQHGVASSVAITTQDVGKAGGKVDLNFFAPNIAVVFLFIGSGLGMRSLLMERSAGTLARLTASPLRPAQIVLGKLLAIFVTGLMTIFVIWAVTTFAFGADWGSPLGVVLMAVGATLAMCGIGVFLTSLAKNEQQAFGITMLVGLALALLGGNLLPSGSLPDAFQVLALGTPNGWALSVSAGWTIERTGQQRHRTVRRPARDRGDRGRARHDQGAPDGRAVTAVIWVNLKRAMGDRRLLIIGTLVPVVIILITGLLEGNPKEPIGLLHPSARLLHLAESTNGVRVRVEANRTDLTDDILRGRVVAGIVQLPATSSTTSGAEAGAVRADFLVESATTDAVQARTDVVALMDLIAAEGNNPKFTNETLKVTATESPLSPFAYVAPANLVLFMGIAVLVLSAGIVETRRLGVAQRLSAAPITKRAVVFGQMASMMVTAIAMALGLLFVGIILFNVHWGNPLSVLLVVVLLGICIAALSVIIGTWAAHRSRPSPPR